MTLNLSTLAHRHLLLLLRLDATLMHFGKQAVDKLGPFEGLIFVEWTLR